MGLSAARHWPWSSEGTKTAEMQEKERPHKCSAIGSYQVANHVRSLPLQHGISAGHIERPRLEKVGRRAEERDPGSLLAEQVSSYQLDRRPFSRTARMSQQN